MPNDNNVIYVKPRRHRVVYKGMHGWVEYHPGTRTWSYRLKTLVTFTHEGDTRTEAEAVLELKRAIDILTATNSTTRSID